MNKTFDIAIALFMTASAVPAPAQDAWPTRAVRLVVPSSPGGGTDAYPKIETYVSFMVVAPAGTPPAIIQRLSAEIINAMKSPALRERLEGLGYVPIFDTPDEFAASLKRERAMWAGVIRRNNIVAD